MLTHAKWMKQRPILFQRVYRPVRKCTRNRSVVRREIMPMHKCCVLDVSITARGMFGQ